MKLFVVCMLSVCVPMVGCVKKAQEKVTEKMIEKVIQRESGKKAKVDLSKQAMKIETQDGEMTMTTGKSAKIPDGFPKDVYLFKGADVEMAMTLPQGVSVILKTTKGKAKVVENYKKEMESKGWEQKAFMDMGEQTMLTYAKEKRFVNVGVGTDNGDTRISLTVAHEK